MPEGIESAENAQKRRNTELYAFSPSGLAQFRSTSIPIHIPSSPSSAITSSTHMSSDMPLFSLNPFLNVHFDFIRIDEELEGIRRLRFRHRISWIRGSGDPFDFSDLPTFVSLS
jgi:hypothetical protein